jgi:cyclophilin family peptidyl-prolyl cis-trans isomerase
MRRLTLPLLLCLAVVAAGCGSDSGGDTSSSATAAATTAAATPTTSSEGDAGCRTVAAAKPKPGTADKPAEELTASDQVTVTLDTNCGSIPIALDTKRAPKTASSFASLARQGFYDGLSFHRIVPGFVIQGGDPQGTGIGGPGYKVVEAPPSDLRYAPGVVAMAKTGAEKPGTSGSQFFIVSGPQAESLPPDYALVGKVTGDGMKTVAKIDATPADQQGVPSTPIVISKATVSG